MRPRLRARATDLLAAPAALLVTGCALVDHFRYPTGKGDVLAYRRAMAETEVGMLRAEFEALWAGDADGHRILAVEVEEREGGTVRRFFIGFTIEYMEAAGRDVDRERRDVKIPTTPMEQDSVRAAGAPPTHEFWTRVRVTDVVTCIDEWVASVSRGEGSKSAAGP